MYNYDYKKIKLLSNPYSQLLVHNVASIFSGKRWDRYKVRIFFSVLKIVALPLWPLTLWSVDVVVLSRFDGFVSLFHVCESQFWLWTPTKLVNWIRFFFSFFLMVMLSKSSHVNCHVSVVCGVELKLLALLVLPFHLWFVKPQDQIGKLHVKSYCFVFL